MDLKLSLVLVFCVVYVRCDYDDNEDHDIFQLIDEQTSEVNGFVDNRIEELKSFILETFGPRLQHIEDIVTSMEKRELISELCTDDTCGEHGSCDISDHLNSTICHCSDGYEGDACEIIVKCRIEYNEVMSQPSMPGMFIPQCEKDGSYSPVQFLGSRSYCVAADGQELHGFDAPRWESPKTRTCQCARDYDADPNASSDFVSIRCNKFGDYLPHVCDDTGCVCQDSHGNTYGEKRPLGDLQPHEC